MRVSERLGHGTDDGRALLPGRGMPLQPASKILAVEIIGDDEDLAVLRADVVHGDYSRVSQAGQLAGFAEQAVGLCGRYVGAAAENLDGDGPIELRVVPQVDRAERPFSQPLSHLIAAKRSRRGRGGREVGVRDRRSGECAGHERLLRPRRLIR